jgi:hypothetical protein
MQHTLRLRACDDGSVLLEEHTLAYGLVCGYERCAAELGVPAGRRVRMELLDDAGRLLDWRIYVVSVTGGQFRSVSPLPALSERTRIRRLAFSGGQAVRARRHGAVRRVGRRPGEGGDEPVDAGAASRSSSGVRSTAVWVRARYW